MTKKTAALFLTVCLPAATATAQEVVYVIPAANPPPIGSVQKPEETPRLSSRSFRESRRDSGDQDQRGLWRRRARSDLYANPPPGSNGLRPAGDDPETGARGSGAGSPERITSNGFRDGRVRTSAPASTAERDRQVVYAHRVREGGLRDPYAPLQPDGRPAPPAAQNTGSEPANINTNAAASGITAPAGRPAEPDSAQPVSTRQPASNAETFSALSSSAGASGTSNSLFVGGALATVRERSRPEWDSLGIRAGAFILRPSADAETEFTDNAALSTNNRKSDVVGILRAGFTADSDWSRHALSASVSAEIGRYAREKNQNYVTLDMALLGRVDVRERTSIDTEVSYGLTREARSNISSGGSAARRPLVATYSASALGTHRFNRLSVSLRAGFDHVQYGKSLLIGGGSDSNDDRDYSDMSSTARATYELKPGVSVYSEGGISLRRHTRRVDDGGLKRNSDGISGSVGARFELGRLIRADAAVGVVHRNYRDASLKDVTAFTANAELAWNVTELTTITAEISTDVSETDLAGVSAAVERRAAFGIQHELMRNVILGAEVSGEYNKAIGGPTRETVFSADLSAEYRINRNATLSANAARTQRSSNQAGGDYVENTLRLGLNLKL